jgi:hypothetical protein
MVCFKSTRPALLRAASSLEDVGTPLLRRQLFVACSLVYPLVTNASLAMVRVCGQGF